jgi:translation initiation factor IF-1|tara:strand:- start:304 stop:873 length:570 start_codon:yes stop_codon:yes gene_type:complete
MGGKNSFGGNKTKKAARKNLKDNVSVNKKIRYIEDTDEEMYAIVAKIQGNGQCIVLCHDNVERVCIIRQKFSGRNKQRNLIQSGSWVIIGKRMWETIKRGKLEKCDLLEIYDNTEKHKFIQQCKSDISCLIKYENSQTSGFALKGDITYDDEHLGIKITDEEEYDSILNIPENQTEDTFGGEIIDFDEI